MSQAKSGDRVRVHYTGRLEDGTVFDASEVEFTLGEGRVIPGLEDAVEGMFPGQTRTAWVPAGDGFGPHRDDLLLVVGRGRFPAHIDPHPGQRLRMRREGEAPVLVTVVEVSDGEVTLDGNHPLAGRELTLEVELVEIA